MNAHDLHDQSVGYPERRIHMVRVSGGERGDRGQSQRLHSSHEFQRICVVVLGRFYESHRIKGVEVGVELPGGVAS